MNANKGNIVIKVNDLHFSYENKKVVKNINLELREGEVLGIIGESGAGKSSLLKLLSGLLDPEKGSVMYRSQRVEGAETLIPGHDAIKYVDQEFGLMPYLSVSDNILRNALSSSEHSRKSLLRHFQKELKINEVGKYKADNISGGQKQRTALATALASKADVLVLDEPFSNLDYPLKRDIIQMLQGDWKPSVMLVVTHEPDDVMILADRILVMEKGELIQLGTTEEIFKNPKNEYVARLLGPVNILEEPEILDLGKNKFIRPHELSISRNGKGLICTVENCTYKGAVFEIEVSSAKLKRTMIAYSTRSFKIGEKARLRIKKGHLIR